MLIIHPPLLRSRHSNSSNHPAVPPQNHFVRSAKYLAKEVWESDCPLSLAHGTMVMLQDIPYHDVITFESIESFLHIQSLVKEGGFHSVLPKLPPIEGFLSVNRTVFVLES